MTGNASEILDQKSPANTTAEPAGNRRERVPMSVPMRKLEVPDLDGYHLHWIRGSDIPRALAAWYEFVDYDEVPVNQRNPGIDTEVSGNTDLGSRVSIAAGTGADSRPERLYLMKLKEEFWLKDREKIDSRNAGIMGSIFRGEKIISDSPTGRGKGDHSADYVDMERTKAVFSRRRIAKPTT